jgi:hypothetical protein
MTKFPDAERGIWFSANRTPLVDGWASESMDGQQVAPLMGDGDADADVGTLRMRSLPNSWKAIVAVATMPVSTRVAAGRARQLTAIRVWWLVDHTSQPSKDATMTSQSSCPSGSSRASRTGSSASASRRASTPAPTVPGAVLDL